LIKAFILTLHTFEVDILSEKFLSLQCTVWRHLLFSCVSTALSDNRRPTSESCQNHPSHLQA